MQLAYFGSGEAIDRCTSPRLSMFWTFNTNVFATCRKISKNNTQIVVFVTTERVVGGEG